MATKTPCIHCGTKNTIMETDEKDGENDTNIVKEARKLENKTLKRKIDDKKLKNTQLIDEYVNVLKNKKGIEVDSKT